MLIRKFVRIENVTFLEISLRIISNIQGVVQVNHLLYYFQKPSNCPLILYILVLCQLHCFQRLEMKLQCNFNEPAIRCVTVKLERCGQNVRSTCPKRWQLLRIAFAAGSDVVCFGNHKAELNSPSILIQQPLAYPIVVDYV